MWETERRETERREAGSQEEEKQGADSEERPDRFDRLRPWYEDLGAPNLFDIHWGVREELAEAGIIPKVRQPQRVGYNNLCITEPE
jgi:hypothetical protein